MKKSLLITAAFASAVLSSAAFASTNPNCTCDGNGKVAHAVSKPEPVKIVHPTGLSRRYENVSVKVTFTLDENGVPHDVQPYGWMDGDLANRLLPVVSQWRFTPSKADGHPVSTRVVMPLQLVEGA